MAFIEFKPPSEVDINAKSILAISAELYCMCGGSVL